MKEFEYSLEWLTNEIIKQHYLDIKNNKKATITINKIELLKMFVKFIKINNREYKGDSNE